MQFNLKHLKRKRKHPSRPWIYYVIFFYPCQVYFHNQCVALKFQMESEIYVKKSESKCIFSLELFYVSANVKRIRNYGLK